jgi:putative hemolysin
MEVVAVLLLIIANGIFSGAEIAIVSARKLRLERQAAAGDRRAGVALRLAGSPNDFLSTVQIGITLIGILSGAIGGASLARRLQGALARLPLPPGWSDWLAMALVVGLITYLSLVIGELVPKRIALSHPESIARAVAPPMRRLSRLCAPLVKLLGISTEGFLRVLGVRPSAQPEITEEEIRAMLQRGAESGVVEEAEQEMMERVFRLGDRPVRAIMTPRTEICWLDLNDPPEQNLRKVIASPHARFPVGRGNLDDCVGIVRGNQLLAARVAGEAIDLDPLLQPPLFVTEGVGGVEVIERFRRSGMHLALVMDEYGGINGLVTLTDLMEAIVGDLPAADQQEDPMVIRREDGSWLLDGLLGVGDFLELVGREDLPGDKPGRYHTLGGLVMHVLGHVPRAGEHFEWDGLRFEVMDMDGHRVDKVLVTPTAALGTAAD